MSEEESTTHIMSLYLLSNGINLLWWWRQNFLGTIMGDKLVMAASGCQETRMQWHPCKTIGGNSRSLSCSSDKQTVMCQETRLHFSISCETEEHWQVSEDGNNAKFESWKQKNRTGYDESTQSSFSSGYSQYCNWKFTWGPKTIYSIGQRYKREVKLLTGCLELQTS